jgi:acyl-CoA thioesterase I
MSDRNQRPKHTGGRPRPTPLTPPSRHRATLTGGQKRSGAGRVLRGVVPVLATLSGFVAVASAAWSSGTAAAVPVSPRPGHPRSISTSAVGDGPLIVATSSCPSERPPSKLAGRPLMAVVGASFTAGVGASSPTASWAYLLGGDLGWRAVVKGVPGAGYVRAGKDDMGPVGRLLAEVDLSRSHPSLVVIQAGHDDVGEPQSLIAERETADLEFIRKYAPDARIAIVSVFLRRATQPSRPDTQTNNTIVATAEKVDPSVIIFNPIAGHWHFKRNRGGLHPDEAGDIWIARHVAEGLVAEGVTDFNSPACLSDTNPSALNSTPRLNLSSAPAS